MKDCLDYYVQFTENNCQETFTEMLSKPAFERTDESFWEYLDHLRISGGNLASFWMTYIDLVQIMLQLLKASREGNWLLQLSAIHDMIPWCFSYVKQNYARYLSYYYTEMTNLQEEHPEIYAYLSDGGFSVQLGSRNPFGRIPVDQAVEETVNRDTQTPGGTKGFSLKPNAVHRYYQTAEYRNSYLRQLRESLGLGRRQFTHPDLRQSRV